MQGLQASSQPSLANASVPGHCDVLVVGAGLSGLAAARAMLLAAGSGSGLHVVVAEARPRVGGRTLSCALGDDGYDLGGQWIGPTHHLVLGLVQRLGLQLLRQPWFDESLTLQFAAPGTAAAATQRLLPPAPHPSPSSSDGGSGDNNGAGVAASPAPPSLSSGAGHAPLTAEEASELTAVMRTLEAMSETVQGPPWLRCPHAREWDALSALDWLQGNVRHEAVLRELVLFVQTVMSCEPERLSFLYCLYYIRTSGGVAQLADGEGGAQTWRLKGGAQQMSLGLAREVETLGGTLLLGMPVRRVAGWQDAQQYDSPVQLTGTAQQYRGDPDADEHGAAAPSVSAGGGHGRGTAGSTPAGAAGAAATSDALPEGFVSVELGTAAAPAGTAAGRALRRHLEGCVSVELEAGQQLLARRVVLAVPPPVWSRTVRFDPPLPPAPRRLGTDMFMGCAAKCLMLFREPFWQRSGVAPVGRLESFGPIANLFPARIAGHHGLVGIVTAGRAERFVLLLPSEQREQALGQVAAYFGVGRRDVVDKELSMFEAYSFAGQEFTGGCFTALMPPGLATSCGDALRAPVGRLHWAGSETARRSVGYFEGALEAGHRAAEEVAQALGREGWVGQAQGRAASRL